MEEIDRRRRQLIKGGLGTGALVASGVSFVANANALSGSAKQQSLPLPEYERWDLTDMSELLKKGEVTPLELFDAATARFEQRKQFNLLTVNHFDQAREKAIEQSGYSAKQREAIYQKAPLQGVPFALKDLHIQLKDTITTNGSEFYKDALAKQNSTLTDRYQAAGLNILAKLSSPEFGQTATTESKLHGDTLNPWDVRYSSGGSSGGSAVAVAARILPAAHASDGGGSIRIPASHCGVFGLKPSRGLVPMGPGQVEGWMGLSVHNVITRTVRDTAKLLEVTSGSESGSRIHHQNTDFVAAIARPPKRLKVAVMATHPFGLPIDQDCLDAVNKTAELLTSLGHQVEYATPALPIKDMFTGMGIATSSGVLHAIREREAIVGRAAVENEFSPIVWQHIQRAKTFTAQQVYDARKAFDEGGKVFDDFFNQYDVILSPVTAGPPPKIGELTLYQPYDAFVQEVIKASPITALFNMTGLPAMSVPLHWNAENLPIGVHFGAGFGQEPLLLSLAAELETALPWSDRMPSTI
ncbi:amidase [Vibrio sinensis]|uniref:Amidase n=1 Tax=Vibrio sinensis TaxID=2302434 RepID=A0A3A6QRT0_9VIBR|nr:amidase [Vibrio sinensis]RJX71491.1 amidase [Vibrio sinensis]